MPVFGVLGAEPFCWRWQVTDTIREIIRLAKLATDPVAQVMLRVLAHDTLTAGQCALCGRPGANVEDHDHGTGLVRGFLCGSCNTREGMSRGTGDDVFAKYRRRNPYSMLGLVVPYSGFGWEDGRPIGAPAVDTAVGVVTRHG